MVGMIKNYKVRIHNLVIEAEGDSALLDII